MMMKTRKLFALCVMVLLSVSLPVWAGGKKKVVVLDFDSVAVQKSVQRIFGAQVDVGRGLSELVAQYLDVDGTYQPVEREKVEKVLAKQEFAQLDLTNPANVRKLGKALRADAVLVGKVRYMGWRRSRRKSKSGRKALVGVDARLVAVRSGAVLSEAENWGVSDRTGKALLGGKQFEEFGNGRPDFARADFQSTLLGEAVVAAVDRLGNFVLGAREKLGGRQFSVTAMVLSVDGPEAVLNVGQGMGLKVGRRLPVLRETGEVKDRTSGIVLGRLTRRVAVVEIVSMDDLAVVTRVVSGGVQVGDGVKIVMN
jgi:curli biogenesis system outer membrane secretion channel CsgG